MGEVAAAFVGFSMVVGILRADSDEGKLRHFAMRSVAEVGLAGVVAAFLPLTIHAYGAGPETTWRVASTVLFVGAVVGPGIAWRRRGVVASYRAEPIETVVTMALNVGAIVLLLPNVLTGAPGSGARYTTVVLLLLVIAGVQFLIGTFKHPARPPAA